MLWSSLEAPPRDDSIEYPQLTFSWRNKKKKKKKKKKKTINTLWLKTRLVWSTPVKLKKKKKKKKRKSPFEHMQNVQIQVIRRMCKVSSGPLLSIDIYSIVSNNSVSGQWRPRSDCADAQSDLGLRCPHMPEDTFSHVTAKQ